MKIRSSRRQFLQASAAVVGGSLAVSRIPLVAEPLGGSTQQVSASDRVRFGMVGVGMQGSGLLSTAIALPGVQCAAACDLYDGRHVRAREIAGANLKTTRRYQELLADKDIDCIVAAVPDHWHRKIVLDAVSAGKDIYCEKPMSHSVADGVAMVAAAKKSGRTVQIGSQRTSSVLCAKARELVAKGVLGDLQLVEGSLGRNNPNGRGCIRLLPTSPLRRWTGTPGRGMCRSVPLIRRSSLAGVAGRSTAREWPAT
jgi:predicted dehydrogenase